MFLWTIIYWLRRCSMNKLMNIILRMFGYEIRKPSLLLFSMLDITFDSYFQTVQKQGRLNDYLIKWSNYPGTSRSIKQETGKRFLLRFQPKPYILIAWKIRTPQLWTSIVSTSSMPIWLWECSSEECLDWSLDWLSSAISFLDKRLEVPTTIIHNRRVE